ncbi:GGDEF domain-containing protein [Nitrincola sp. MINF-07-Sa-05]|uniref:GGDEF domain-containing protein n=1 Tax=Nitrincola salilacus TaxID=3400273 RepID=UPI0039185B74
MSKMDDPLHQAQHPPDEVNVHRAHKRAEIAEKKIDEMTVIAKVGTGCLSADNLQVMVCQTADLLKARQSWTEAIPFEVIDGVPKTCRASDTSHLEQITLLLSRRCQREEATPPDDSRLLFQQSELTALNEPESLVASKQIPTSAALICAVADETLQAGVLLLSPEPINRDSSEFQMLSSCFNYLSLLADRLQHLRQIEEANSRLTFFAMHDPLTTLPNRRYLIDELGRRLSRAKRTAELIHVAFIDLDNFKQINDVHGHDVGDQFLVAFATRLHEVMRAGDMVARFGGDEFVLIATAGKGKDPEEERTLLSQRILQATLGRFELPALTLDYDGPSIGIITSQQNGLDADQLLSKADEEMYVVKRQRKANRGCADKSGSLA